jgi:hypothetical protein
VRACARWRRPSHRSSTRGRFPAARTGSVPISSRRSASRSGRTTADCASRDSWACATTSARPTSRASARAEPSQPATALYLSGGPLPRGVLGGSPEYLPHGRTQAGDRRLKIHEHWDNLGGCPHRAIPHLHPGLRGRASCAVPDIWPPVTIGATRYIDGGVRSTSNIDLAPLARMAR